jgi:1-acyl-sn-glycerol-3-phosphate acyltransferase
MSSITYSLAVKTRPQLLRGRALLSLIARPLFFGLLLDYKVENVEVLPRTGPVMILMNHVSNLDPIPAVGACKFRDIVPICKAELYEKNWFTRATIDLWGCIPIRRGEVDMDALKLSLKVMEGPDILLVAPEGTRHKDGMREPKEGVAFLAQKSGAIIVPCGLSGTRTHELQQHWKKLHRAPVTVRYGRPVKLKAGLKRADYKRITNELMYQIAPLLTPDIRGEYADLSKATMDTIEYVS